MFATALGALMPLAPPDICKRCGRRGQRFEKNKSKSGKEYYRNVCIPCRSAEYKRRLHDNPEVLARRNKKRRSWFSEDPRRERKYRISSSYGLTLDRFDALLIESCGRCSICGDSFNSSEPFIDHCHATGIVRGLLCNECNCMIGLARDSNKILESAIMYLSGAQAKFDEEIELMSDGK